MRDAAGEVQPLDAGMPNPSRRASISSYNEKPQDGRPDSLPMQVQLQDVTLRDGAQAPDLAFNDAEKLEIAKSLDKVGIAYIQAGYAGRDDSLIRVLASAGLKAKVTAIVIGFQDNWLNDIRSASKAGVQVLQVLVRTAEQQLTAIGMSREETLRRTEKILIEASRAASEVWFIPSYISLAEESYLRRIYAIARDCGIRHCDISDSTGVCKPSAIQYLVRLVKETTGGSVGLHCHNDLGLAVANTIAGFEAGADRADVTVNGYGARAGNCPLDELAVCLELLYGVRSGIRLDQLTALSQQVSAFARAPISPAKPIVGEDVFAQKTDIFLAMTHDDPSLAEPFAPDLVGNKRSIRLGVGSGPYGVRAKLLELGISIPTKAIIEKLVSEITDLALARKRHVSDDEFRQMLSGALARES